MRSLVYIPLQLSLVLSVASLRIPFKRSSSGHATSFSRSRQSSLKSKYGVLAAGGGDKDNGLDLTTVHDLIYMANVTIAGQQYPVQLDTGSSDLWIQGVPQSNNIDISDVTYNLTYGIGWAYGHVAYAPMKFAGISVQDQAFLNVSSSQNPALQYGAEGILGLGFTSLSTIDALINKTNSDKGRSLLYNLFEDNPDEPNFIAFALQRSTQDNDDVEGSFSIGEYEPDYKAVEKAPHIPTFPENSPKRWNVLIDAIMIGDNTIVPNTTVPDAPGNKAVALLDSGTSYSYLPTYICDAIYGQIEGARFDATMGQWSVPCDAEIDMALQIGGEIFPLHPLDVSPKSILDAGKCVGSFIPQSISIGAGQFDWLIGDNFLRSTYSVYDFGDFDSNNKMGNPFVQLLSLTDANGASAEFVASRGGTARTGITYNAIDGTAAAASSTTIGTDLANTLNSIGKYFPVMLAITALNAIALLGGVIAFIVYMVKKNRASSNRASMRNPRGRLTPMPLSRVPSIREPTPDAHAYQPVEEDDMSPSDPRRNTYAGPSSIMIPLAQRPQNAMDSYNPVSMALTEDTLFVPPSPAYRKSSFGSVDRPKSVA